MFLYLAKRQTFSVTTEKQHQIVVSDYHDFADLKHMVNSRFFETSRPLTEKVDQYIEKSFASKKSHLGKTLNTIFQVKLCGPRWPVCSTNSINGGRACALRKLWRPELLKKPRWEALTAQLGQIPKNPPKISSKKAVKLTDHLYACNSLANFEYLWRSSIYRKRKLRKFPLLLILNNWNESISGFWNHCARPRRLTEK